MSVSTSTTEAVHTETRRSDELLCRAIAGVMRGGRNGRLPLFAWTLGLPQSELLEMIWQYFPERQSLESMPSEQYARLLTTVPTEFHGLVDLLSKSTTPAQPDTAVRWLAHALAGACFGNRHLWEDLELAGRESVSTLLERYFEPLYLRNTSNLRWKRFLFVELGAALDIQDMRPPGCTQCDSFRQCFPTSSIGEIQ